MITITPEKMTTAEKLSAMEALWNDLCQHNLLEPSKWHEILLYSREQQRKNGDQTPMNWETAKQKIRNKI